MKQFEISELEEISTLNYANIFNVFDEPKLGVNFKTYSINRSLNFYGTNEASADNSSLFTPYLVVYSDTWATISFQFYQTIELWWLVCKINNIVNPTIDPVIGKTIKVLDSSIVNTILRQIREN
jgi:hypothetical protein